MNAETQIFQGGYDCHKDSSLYRRLEMESKRKEHKFNLLLKNLLYARVLFRLTAIDSPIFAEMDAILKSELSVTEKIKDMKSYLFFSETAIYKEVMCIIENYFSLRFYFVTNPELEKYLMETGMNNGNLLTEMKLCMTYLEQEETETDTRKRVVC